MNKILFVDDEKPLRDTLARWFKRRYECLTAPDGESALKLLEEHPDLALVVTDERMPVMSGSELIRKAKALRPDLSIIMLTAYGSLELAVEAMRNGGADDFYQKPITDLKEFEPVIEKAVQKTLLKREVSALDAESSAPAKNKPLAAKSKDNGGFTGKAPAMEKIYRLIDMVAPKDVTVLIEGESGTGKELVAKAIHNKSQRAKGPFVAIECAAFSKDLLEAELFGYVGGMFTGARKDGKSGCIEDARGGTLFLDEIGEIDTDTQIALLRTLETRSVRRVGSSEEIPVDFRLVAATNRDLAALVKEGKFRADLYYRLKVIDLKTPALREHPQDVPLLVGRFLKEFAAEYSSEVTKVDEDAMQKLIAYPWPGNVRELRNVVEKMTVLATGPVLSLADLPEEISTPTLQTLQTLQTLPHPEHPAHPSPLADTEKREILAALAAAGDNRSKAAEALGISRRTLQRKLKEWKI